VIYHNKMSLYGTVPSRQSLGSANCTIYGLSHVYVNIPKLNELN
jgi:hypothetical protein